MIGRGTRLLEPKKIKPWCTEKDVFLILDCWDNFEYFKLKPKGKELKGQLPLPVRLVGVRINKIEKAIEYSKMDIVEKEVNILRQQIQSLPQDSVVIIEAAAALKPLSDDNYWTKLSSKKIEYLRTEIKPLFRTLSGVDFKAMRFEKDVLETSLALLGKEADNKEDMERFEVLQEAVIEQISELPLSVPMVKRQENLIKAAQQISYWLDCTD